MFGAVIGSIVGSRFHYKNHRSKEFELFSPASFVTDDCIMTFAVAKAIMRTEKLLGAQEQGETFSNEYCEKLKELSLKHMREIGRKYPDCGYGNKLAHWFTGKIPKPHKSFSSGAAMRVTPAGYAAKTAYKAIQLADLVTRIKYDNIADGTIGATSVAVAIFLARHGAQMSDIRNRMSDYYDLDFMIDDIRDDYSFDETCQGTVPQAINAFLESESFEDAIRIAVSIGGDSDTIAAITGAIAEAFYGIPEDIRKTALTYIDNDLWGIYADWNIFFLGHNI